MSIIIYDSFTCYIEKQKQQIKKIKIQPYFFNAERIKKKTNKNKQKKTEVKWIKEKSGFIQDKKNFHSNHAFDSKDV